MLNLYRTMLQLRRDTAQLADEGFEWLDLGPHAVAYRRGDVACIANLGTAPLPLPNGSHPFLASDPLVDRTLPSDTAVWLRL